jgi:hypothetical protein
MKETSGRPHSALAGAYLVIMYFGLTNSPATFQMMMNEIFQDLIIKGIVSVYLDDILIFTNTSEEHRWITHLVLDCMHKHKLYLRPEKCKFEKTKIEYLGVIISHNKVEMDPVKIAGVADCVRGHPSVSLLPLSSPTLPLSICIPYPYLCIISKDRTYSQRPPGLMVRRLPRSRLTDSRRLPASPPARTSTASDGLRPRWDGSA